ncbi:MAG: glycine C-acetyltransferase, partial [Bacteroidota bacterium]
MFKTVEPTLQQEIQDIRDAGLYKSERILVTPQGAEVRTDQGREVLIFCANNYLGLSSHPAVIESAHEAIRTHG